MDPALLLLLWPMLVAICLFFVLFGFAIWRFLHAATPEGQAEAVAGAERWLESKRRDLLPWDERSVGDLSDVVSYWYTSSTNTTTRGKIRAISRRGNLARYISISGISGQHLLACTTAHRWRMQVVQEPTTSLRLWLDDMPFGSWRSGDGALLDARGEVVGHAERASTVTVMGFPTTWDGRWYDIVLRGRTLGRVRLQRGLREMLPRKLPAVEPASLPLEAEAERWLLAVVLAEHLLQGYSWQIGPVSGGLRRPVGVG